MTTHGIVSPLSQAIPIRVGIDTHAEVDLVDVQLVRQLGLKPCRNKDLPILRAINQQNLHTYGAYNLRLELTDSYGVRRTTLRPYIAIDRDQGDSQILLGMPALDKLKILIDCEQYQWQYKLEKSDVRIDTYKRFRKWTKNANVYALIEVNHLIRELSPIKPTYPTGPTYVKKPIPLIDKLPACLNPYLDVFSLKNAKQLAPYRNVDLAINLQPGKEPLYSLIYPLS
jgi:hypothetical protein